MSAVPVDKYTTTAKVAAPARFLGNGEVAVADGTSEDDLYPVARGPFPLSSRWTATCAKLDGRPCPRASQANIA